MFEEHANSVRFRDNPPFWLSRPTVGHHPEKVVMSGSIPTLATKFFMKGLYEKSYINGIS